MLMASESEARPPRRRGQARKTSNAIIIDSDGSDDIEMVDGSESQQQHIGAQQTKSESGNYDSEVNHASEDDGGVSDLPDRVIINKDATSQHGASVKRRTQKSSDSIAQKSTSSGSFIYTLSML